MWTPSNLHRKSRVALCFELLLSVGEILTDKSGVTVSNPQSKARS